MATAIVQNVDQLSSNLTSQERFGTCFTILKKKKKRNFIQEFPTLLNQASKIKYFTDKHVLREFGTMNPALQEILDAILSMETKQRYLLSQKHR